MGRILLLLASLVLALGAPADLLLAVDYFVSGTGSDGNGGLSSGDAFRTITKAMTVAGAGDKVIVESGTYNGAAGETFPIPINNGVELAGPGDGTAVVDGSGTGFDTFWALGGVNTTIISGLSIINDSRDCLSVTTTHSDLQVVSNTFTHGVSGVACFPNGSYLVANNMFMATGTAWAAGVRFDPWTSAVAEVRGNTFLGNGTGYGIYGSASTGEFLSMMILSNSVSGCGDGIDLNLDISSSDTDGTAVYLVQSNVIKNNVRDGLDMDLEISDYDTITGFLTLSVIRNEIFGNGSSGFYMTIECTSDTNTAFVTLLVVSNEVYSNSVDGFRWHINPEETDCEIFVTGTVECNDLRDNGGDGFRLQLHGSRGLLEWPVEIRYNAFVDNVSNGLVLDIEAWDSGFNSGMDFDSPIFGNTILGNGADGVLFSSSTSFASPVLAPDFGGGGSTPGGLGRNTIQDNDTAATGNFDFSMMATDDQPTIKAMGNWWGTANPEPNIWHSVDGLPNGTVDFGGVLSDPLIFTASKPSLAGVVTVTPDADTPFVHKAGRTPIVVTLNGAPGLNVQVAADGSSLTFGVPPVPAGTYLLFIRNPGGQSGSITFVITGGRISRCFVATAAYGDDEAPEVRLLRRWRDESLSGNPLGRLVVRAYYAASPPLAEAVSVRPLARTVTRAALTPVVGAVRLWLEARWLYGLAGAALLLRLLRRRR